ncbi:hypothetical protein DA075_10040 [Methylobacterium currus]|uniref:Uncharacterized protein n=1 Tax=Methylobacterium currus TaxID=2051553 RepID=A0A2R4WI40_9HYPH|nr:hypothetical protein [Methylobacterium currus]AWB21212.1 hypothetical protein DA075_10040 [Methylobacterium currus]
MHTAFNILDAEQARYRALHAALVTAPLPQLEAHDGSARRYPIPHIDAEAVRQAILIDRADRLAVTASRVAGVAALFVGLAASVQVVALYVGSVL